MVWSEIALICVGAALVIVVCAWIITTIVKHNNSSDQRVDGVYIKDGVRYTKDKKVVDEQGRVAVTLNKGDIMLERGKKYRVTKTGKILPGKYTVLSADENVDEINIRIGGLVKKVKHFSDIVLTEGDEISAVSANVVLR